MLIFPYFSRGIPSKMSTGGWDGQNIFNVVCERPQSPYSYSVFDQICIEQIERESGATFSLIDSLCSSSSFRVADHRVTKCQNLFKNTNILTESLQVKWGLSERIFKFCPPFVSTWGWSIWSYNWFFDINETLNSVKWQAVEESTIQFGLKILKCAMTVYYLQL